MQIEKYEINPDSEFSRFEFISKGPKGAILKRIQFQPLKQADFYNLAFGDVDFNTDKIDDLIVSNNGDSEKVLATVISALDAFFDYHPNASVYATGSTKSRTRLYRIGINRYFEEMEEAFYLFGQIGNEFFRFEKGMYYEGFLAQRKFY